MLVPELRKLIRNLSFLGFYPEDCSILAREAFDMDFRASDASQGDTEFFQVWATTASNLSFKCRQDTRELRASINRASAQLNALRCKCHPQAKRTQDYQKQSCYSIIGCTFLIGCVLTLLTCWLGVGSFVRLLLGSILLYHYL